eukprot:2343651-Rhodomonas_salina.2
MPGTDTAHRAPGEEDSGQPRREVRGDNRPSCVMLAPSVLLYHHLYVSCPARIMPVQSVQVQRSVRCFAH